VSAVFNSEGVISPPAAAPEMIAAEVNSSGTDMPDPGAHRTDTSGLTMSDALATPDNSSADFAAENASRETPEVREGDWKAYLHSIAKCRDNKELIERYGSMTAYKRACAMAYLGKRAQLHGGICSMRHPHIMTPQFISNLEAFNRAQRYARYPWLEALMNVLAEIERIQDEISTGSNVISLVSSK